jgi:hypothetical protein
MDKENPIRDKSFDFAVRIVKLYEYLSNQKKEFIMSKQLMRWAQALVRMLPKAFMRSAKKILPTK